jgi:flavin-dependent dehydrogenase
MATVSRKWSGLLGLNEGLHLTQHDVIIAGGGCAGCVTAMALAGKGLNVVVLERTSGHAPRVGEHLPPDARPLLQQLGLWRQFVADNHLASAGIRVVWNSPAVYEREYILSPYGSGWNLDRSRFDQMLEDAARAAGAAVMHGVHVSALDAGRQGWLVTTMVAGQTEQFSGRFLVDATGRASALVRRLGGGRKTYDRLFGLVGWMSAGRNADVSDSRLWIEAVADGWWYAALLPEKRLVVALMTDLPALAGRHTDVEALWFERLQQTQQIRRRAENFELIDGIVTKSANSYCMDRVAGHNWLAVGDAAAAYDPLSSVGISRALQSGYKAAAVIHAHRSGNHRQIDEYERQIQRDFAGFLALRMTYYESEMRWPNQPFWQARQRSVSSQAGVTVL